MVLKKKKKRHGCPCAGEGPSFAVMHAPSRGPTVLRRGATSPHLVFAAHSSFFFRANSAFFCSGEPFLSRGEAAAEADAAAAAAGGRGWLLDVPWAASAAARADARVLRPPFLLPPTEGRGGGDMVKKGSTVSRPRGGRRCNRNRVDTRNIASNYDHSLENSAS